VKKIGEISDELVIFQKNHPTEFGSGEVGDMGGRPPTDDFFLRKLRLSLEDFPDPEEKKSYYLLANSYSISVLLTISSPQ
jgi:hypothetical protein